MSRDTKGNEAAHSSPRYVTPAYEETQVRNEHKMLVNNFEPPSVAAKCAVLYDVLHAGWIGSFLWLPNETKRTDPIGWYSGTFDLRKPSTVL